MQMRKLIILLMTVLLIFSACNKNTDQNLSSESNVRILIVKETVKRFMEAEEIVNNYLDLAADGELKFISGDSALKMYETQTIDGIEGITLSTLVEKLGLKASDSYIITSINNSSIGISKSDLENGILYQDDDSSYAVKFKGLSEKTNVKKVISIAVEQSN